MSDAEYATELVDFLLLRTSLDEVAQFAVTHLLEHLGPWEMDIYDSDAQGIMRLVGSFGAGSGGATNIEGREGTMDPVLWNALRRGQPEANFPLPDNSILTRMSVLDSVKEGPRVLWPLTAPARMVGLLQLRFVVSPDHDELVTAMNAIAPVMSLVLSLLQRSVQVERRQHAWMRSTTVGGEQAQTHPATRSRDVRPGDRVGDREPRVSSTSQDSMTLTDRQKLILSHLARGETNDQIAHVIRFSASTVRQETMVIYRVLGVPGRTEAVAAARELGWDLSLPVDKPSQLLALAPSSD